MKKVKLARIASWIVIIAVFACIIIHWVYRPKWALLVINIVTVLCIVLANIRDFRLSETKVVVPERNARDQLPATGFFD